MPTIVVLHGEHPDQAPFLIPATPGTSGDNQIDKGQHKNTNKSQSNMALSEQSYSNTTSPGYPNINEAQENDLKSNLIKITDAFKEAVNKSLKKYRKIQLDR